MVFGTWLLPAMQAHYITITHFLSESQMQHLTLQDQYFFIICLQCFETVGWDIGKSIQYVKIE